MLPRTYEGQNCSVARALEVVGERWSVLIIRDALFRGISRYSDFQRSLAIAPNILAARLQGFVQAGLMVVDTSPDTASRHYQLTDKARDLAPVILALTVWGDQWAAPQGPPVTYEHHGCGGVIHQETHCETCGQLAPATEMTARPARPKAP